MIASGEMGIVDTETALETSLLTRKPVQVSELAETSSGGISTSSLDPFGDEVRTPPNSRSACNEPIVVSEGRTPRDDQAAIVGNRFWRKMCNLYFDGPRTQEYWDVIYEEIKEPPTDEMISTMKETTVTYGLMAVEQRTARQR
jgi:hypothetical protein